MYYEAKQIALSNGAKYHLAAYTNKGQIGTNKVGLTSKFRKRHPGSNEYHYDIHAEVDLVLRCSRVPEKIKVVRFTSDGTPTMAKPCIHCQNFLRHAGVKQVRFTNWDGQWEEMKL